MSAGFPLEMPHTSRFVLLEPLLDGADLTEALDCRWAWPGGMPGEMARTEGGGPGSAATGERRCEYAL